MGGVANVAHRQAKHLAQQGHRVTVVTASEERNDANSTSQEGIRVIRLPVRTGRFPAYGAGDALGVRQSQVRKQYEDLLINSSADVLVSHSWQAWNTDWAMDIAGKLNLPVCLYSHGTSVNDTTGQTGWLRWLRWRHYVLVRMPQALRRISLLIILDSHADNNRFYDVTLARRYGTQTETVANCGSTDLQWAEPWQPVGLKTQNMALSVGQFTPQKNPAQVLATFIRHAPPDWTLVLCGPIRTKYLQQLETLYSKTAKRRQTPSVLFLTSLSQTQLMGLYKRADLFLSSSRTEAQPLVVLDAMAASVPFLSSDVGCVRNLPGGMVARNAREFNLKAEVLMSDPQLRKSLSGAGRRAYETTFNAAATLGRLEHVLIKVIESRGTRSA